MIIKSNIDIYAIGNVRPVRLSEKKYIDSGKLVLEKGSHKVIWKYGNEVFYLSTESEKDILYIGKWSDIFMIIFGTIFLAIGITAIIFFFWILPQL